MQYKVGDITDFKEKSSKLLKINNRNVLIYRDQDGFFAIKDGCPHKGASFCKGLNNGTMLPSDPGTLEYGLQGKVVTCPWHGFEFDIETGCSLFNTTPYKIVTYQVSVENQDIYIEMK